MRICIDLTSLADNLSGIERYAACISLELLKHKEDQFILLFKDEVHPFFQIVYRKKNIRCIVIPRCNKLLFNQVKLPWIIHKVSADWYLFMAFPVPILTFKKNMISTIHDICCWDCPETMNGMSKWYFRISHLIAINKCKAIMTISEFSKYRIHEKLKYPIDKIWLIYCGINQDEFTVHPERFATVKEKYNLPDEYILSLSTLEPRKNLTLLIHAYENLVEKGEVLPDLVLAGRKGWKMEEMLNSVDGNVKKHIVFTGFIDDIDLPEVYGNSKYFVYPSKYEGFGMPPLEAMACGTLVVSSDAGSLGEVMGNAGVVFKSQDIDELENAILKMEKISSRERKKMLHEEKVRIGLFSWNHESMKLYGLMENSKK